MKKDCKTMLKTVLKKYWVATRAGGTIEDIRC